MRIKIILSGSKEKIQVSLKHTIPMSYIHKCFGNINRHGKHMYSISPLMGGKILKDKSIDFNNGGFFIVASQNSEIISELLISMIQNPDLEYGIKLKNVEHLNDKFYHKYNYFSTLSPILLKNQNKNETSNFVTCKNSKNFESLLSENLKRKIHIIDSDLNLDDFLIEILDEKHQKEIKVYNRKLNGNTILNVGSLCNLKINANKKVSEVIYNIGLGNSTGYGFGMLYLQNNFEKYMM